MHPRCRKALNSGKGNAASFCHNVIINCSTMKTRNGGVATQTSQIYCPLTADGLRIMCEIAARLGSIKVVRYMRKEGML